MKLKARIVQPSAKRLDRLPLPVIVEKEDGGFAIPAAGRSLFERPRDHAHQRGARVVKVLIHPSIELDDEIAIRSLVQFALDKAKCS